MEKVPTKGRERELTGGPETVLTIAMEEVLTLPMENLLDIHNASPGSVWYLLPRGPLESACLLGAGTSERWAAM